MVKHVVMIKLKSFSDSDKKRHLTKLKNDLDQLTGNVNVIKYLETGINVSNSSNAYDFVLITHFENENDLNVYRTHLEHVKVVEYINEIKSGIKVVDYII